MLFLQFGYILCFILVVKSQESVFEYDPDWVAPDAWSRHRAKAAKETSMQNDDTEITQNTNQPNKYALSGTSTCVKNQEMLEISEMFYKRLVKSLFKQKKFKEITSDLLSRTFQLKVEQKQLQRILSLIDDDEQDSLIDLDDIVSAVLLRSEGGIVEYLKDEVISVLDYTWTLTNNMLQNKMLRLLFLAMIFIAIALLIQKKWGCHLLLVMLFMILLIGYGVTYINCNNKLETDEIIDFLERGSRSPCDGVDTKEDFSFWSYLTGGSSIRNKCTDFMRNQKIKFDICLPHDVLIEFSSDIYSKMFEKYFVATINAFNNATQTYSYIGQIFAFSIFLTLMIVFGKEIIGTTIKSLFKYGIKGSPESKDKKSENTENRENIAFGNNNAATIILARTVEKLVTQHQNRNAINTNMNENRIEDISIPDAIESPTTKDSCVDDFEHIEIDEPDTKLGTQIKSKETDKSNENCDISNNQIENTQDTPTLSSEKQKLNEENN